MDPTHTNHVLVLYLVNMAETYADFTISSFIKENNLPESIKEKLDALVENIITHVATSLLRSKLIQPIQTSKRNYNILSLADLKKEAKSKNISNYSKMNKEELKKLLVQYDIDPSTITKKKQTPDQSSQTATPTAKNTCSGTTKEGKKCAITGQFGTPDSTGKFYCLRHQKQGKFSNTGDSVPANPTESKEEFDPTESKLEELEELSEEEIEEHVEELSEDESEDDNNDDGGVEESKNPVDKTISTRRLLRVTKPI